MRKRRTTLISEYLPITVVVTLLLFCTREILDLTKKHNEKKRTLTTLKLLLSEELKSNFYALDSLYSIIVRVNSALKLGEKNIPVRKNITTDRFGNSIVDITLGDEGKHGFLHMPFPQFSTVRYNSFLKELASLDLKLYEHVTELYKEMRYCEKIRCEIISYLEREDNLSYWAFDHRLEMMLQREEQYRDMMQALHKKFIGRRMLIHWGDVINEETK